MPRFRSTLTAWSRPGNAWQGNPAENDSLGAVTMRAREMRTVGLPTAAARPHKHGQK
ncbi:hypothetical protein RA210_U10733 [Rubrivivax sp. A210]|nr:hypothetical protein RA210_U10733 [Rubrivivax sp. A210]